jgi:hypothetical protein
VNGPAGEYQPYLHSTVGKTAYDAERARARNFSKAGNLEGYSSTFTERDAEFWGRKMYAQAGSPE